MNDKQKLTIELLSNRVLIDVLSNETKTDSGLIISTDSDNAEEIQNGVVVAVGFGKKGADNVITRMNVKVGDKVMFQYAKQIVINGKRYMLANEDDIIMIIN